MTGTIWVAVAVFVGVAALVGSVAMLFRDRSDSKMEDRLSALTNVTAGQGGRDLPGTASVLAQPLDAQPTVIDAIFERFGNWDLFFEQADTSLTLTKLVVTSVILGAGGIVFGFVFHAGPIFAPILGLVLGALPMMWILWRRKRRLKAFDAQLSDAMEMLARGLRSGQSLGFGFSMVSSEMANPISKEFGRVFEEQNLGIPLEESLRSLTNRVPSLDLKFFATAVVLQRQTGGDLAEILDKIGALIRERFRIWGQVQALTGEGRLSGVVLMALPVVLFLVVWKLNPEYVTPLFSDPMGKKMLLYAIIMQVVGAFVIRKIINIEV